jgi:hypothetical protein
MRSNISVEGVALGSNQPALLPKHEAAEGPRDLIDDPELENPRLETHAQTVFPLVTELSVCSLRRERYGLSSTLACLSYRDCNPGRSSVT